MKFYTTELSKAGIGFDQLVNKHLQMFDTIRDQTSKGYPAYNIRKLSESNYAIELVAAGISIDELDITLDKDVLRVVCTPKKVDAATMVYQGMSYKGFTKDFILAEGVEVTNVNLVNGILKINLVKPEEIVQKPITFRIGNGS
jgi:molecular chaperone IbpA